MVFRDAQTSDVTAKQLYQDYKRNTAAADYLYKGKSFRFTGTILRIKQDPFHPPTLEFATGDAFDTVDVRWADGSDDVPSDLREGKAVTLNCKGDGIVLGSPSLRCQ